MINNDNDRGITIKPYFMVIGFLIFIMWIGHIITVNPHNNNNEIEHGNADADSLSRFDKQIQETASLIDLNNMERRIEALEALYIKVNDEIVLLRNNMNYKIITRYETKLLLQQYYQLQIQILVAINNNKRN